MPQQTSKKSASSKSSGSEWAKLLGEALLTRENKPKGEGWMRIEALMGFWNMGRKRCYAAVSALMDSGKVESFSGTSLAKNGKLVTRVWYRIKK